MGLFEGNDDGSGTYSRVSPFDFSKPGVATGWKIFTAIALIVSGILIGVSLQRISSVEYGVEYDTVAKILDDAAKQGGLHVGPPGYRFVKFPSTQITAALSDSCVSRDGLSVEFSVTFQYQMTADNMVKAIEKYRNFKTWSEVVEAAGESAIHHSCSEFNITDFQSLRSKIQDAMFDNLRWKLEGSVDGGITDSGVYAIASSLQLENVALPEAYKDAVSDKQQAEEDIALAKNQRTQQTTKARTEKLAADEEARKILNTAENTRNITLTEAELKAQEILFAFEKEKEVLLQAKEFFNLSANGILAYMTNQLYASVDDLHVSLGDRKSVV